MERIASNRLRVYTPIPPCSPIVLAQMPIFTSYSLLNRLQEQRYGLGWETAPTSCFAISPGCEIVCRPRSPIFLAGTPPTIQYGRTSLVTTGIIGELISVGVCYAYDAKRAVGVLEEGAQYCHWSYRLNGGLLQDLMPHPASLLFEFIPEITEVQSMAQNRGTLAKGWCDEIRVSINSQSLTAYMSISLNERPDGLLLTIKGRKGAVEANLYNNMVILQSFFSKYMIIYIYICMYLPMLKEKLSMLIYFTF